MLTIVRLIRNDEGNALIPVILISLLVGVLAALTLTTGEQADWASAKDRNHEIALGVTEAGVHEAISRMESQIPTTFALPPAGTGRTEEGSYDFTFARSGETIVIDAVGTVAAEMRQQRKRHVKVTLAPPELFPGAGYALFSKTNIYLKNNNEIYDGDVWANDSLWAEGGATIDGSLTSAQSWVKLDNGAEVSGYVWAGGRKCDVDGQVPCQSGFGVSLGQNSEVMQWVKSSLSAPTCDPSEQNAYKVVNDGRIHGDVTSYGPVTGSGIVSPGQTISACTTAPARLSPPVFTFNPTNYDPTTYHEFGFTTGSGAQEFNTAFQNNQNGINKAAFVGTYVIRECGAGIVNISGAEIAGNVTVITNPEPCNGVKGARIRAEGVDDTNVPSGQRAEFVLVSHYEPPAGKPCTDKDDLFCAISAKNHFDSTCKTATLVYADNGPVAMKNDTGPNDNIMCGSVIANGIHMKNDLKLTYDPLFDRVLGFGPRVYEVARWEELPVP